MKITKFGHCCLLIEEDKLRILIDPGKYSARQNSVRGIDVVLITHEHHDHFHVDSVKSILKNNPRTKIITNKSVGALLKKEGIKFVLLESGKNTLEKGILIEGVGDVHALLHSSRRPIQNTGYFIAGKFFYPGDSWVKPRKKVPILALSVAGSWMKISEAIDYARKLKPKIWFPVHDGILKYPDSWNNNLHSFFEEGGPQFIILKVGKKYEF